jgi:hypothetical protein
MIALASTKNGSRVARNVRAVEILSMTASSGISTYSAARIAPKPSA